ncbi:MAG: hypothetical protein J2P18_01180 [Nocardia sp.]|nr:hypothetical protein [Nocardia sp.]
MFEFHWNDRSEAHIARHNVSPQEVQEATQRPYYTYSGHNETEILLGRTYTGRYLLVVMCHAMDGRFYVATARDMTANERREYNRKAR